VCELIPAGAITIIKWGIAAFTSGHIRFLVLLGLHTPPYSLSIIKGLYVLYVIDFLMTLSFVLEDRTVPRKAIQKSFCLRPNLGSILHTYLMTLEIVIGLHGQETGIRQTLIIPPYGVVATL
jgi:hypothetical protein